MSEPAFIGAGKKVGMELWRIEKLKPVKQPKVDGKFNVGDSYILLSTTMQGNKFLWNIHFWLGKETSDDEAGCAAYKTVELDDSLGGGPVQYRETQESESPLFLSYFKSGGGIQYVPGGVESGFRKVERDVYEPRLLHCKGARTVRVSEVPISNKSLNKGDVFILDLGLKIYVFNGPGANRQEKSKGVEVAGRTNSDERNGRAEIIFLDDDIKNPAFWGPLGGFIDPAKLPEGACDTTVKDVKITPKLLVVNDAGAFSTVSKEGSPLAKEMLTTENVYLVHSAKLYLWIGKKAPANKKREATASAVKYLKSSGLPASTSIERVSEGVETNGFRSEFAKWEIIIQKHSGVASMGPDKNIDVSALLARKQIEDAPVDDGKGKVEVWVVSDFKLEPVNPAKYGQFFGGDSYVILYTYLKNKLENYIIYFWLGNKSSTDEKGSAALLAKEKDDALGGKPVQVRVVQGKEPAHFHQLFKGKMVVHAGGKASGFKNTNDSDSYDTDGTALFRVKGSNSLNTVAVQVEEKASALNSEDCFVLITPSHAYSWNGRGSNKEEQAVSMNIAQALSTTYNGVGGRVVEAVAEGSEPAAFWSALGGKTEYAALAPGSPAPKDPRLFQCSNATGSFNVEEVYNYNQSDLNDEDVFLLDTYTTVYLWIGSQSNAQEKEKSFQFAQKFISESNDGRDYDCPVISVHAGQEPAMFTAQFVGWDDKLFQSSSYKDPYLAKINNLQSPSAKEPSAKASPYAGIQLKSASSTPQPSARAAPVSATPPGSSKLNTPVLKSVNAGSAKTDSAKSPTPAAPSPAPAANLKSTNGKVPEDLKGTSATVPVITTLSASQIQGKYNWDEVKNGTIPGMDTTQKELYLSDAVFLEKIGMDKAAFAAMPKWKQVNKKKELGIF